MQKFHNKYYRKTTVKSNTSFNIKSPYFSDWTQLRLVPAPLKVLDWQVVYHTLIQRPGFLSFFFFKIFIFSVIVDLQCPVNFCKVTQVSSVLCLSQGLWILHFQVVCGKKSRSLPVGVGHFCSHSVGQNSVLRLHLNCKGNREIWPNIAESPGEKVQ